MGVEFCKRLSCLISRYVIYDNSRLINSCFTFSLQPKPQFNSRLDRESVRRDYAENYQYAGQNMTEGFLGERWGGGWIRMGGVWCLFAFIGMMTGTAAKAGDRLKDIASTTGEVYAINQSFTYTTNNGAITIVKYIGPGGEVVIPSRINALPVTRIGDSAFYACTVLAGVTFSNHVTSIGDNAFRSCTALANVTLPPSLTSIGDGAFSCCISLAHITIPSGVTRLGDWVFSYCTGLVSVKIPDSVTGIGGSAFHSCTSLVDVPLPDTLTTIGDMAFYSCSGLASITIPKGVTHIGALAFSRCANLRVLYFKGNLPALGSSVLNGCGHATVYYLPGTTGWGATVAECPATRWMGSPEEAPVCEMPAVTAPATPVVKKPGKGRRGRR
jgi:hypothetical protein